MCGADYLLCQQRKLGVRLPALREREDPFYLIT